MTTERRRWPRVLYEALLICHPTARRASATYVLRNVSQGGVMFESPTAVTPGTPLTMEWSVPVGSHGRIQQRVTAEGRVRWTQGIPAARYPGSNRFRVGAALTRIGLADRSAITRFVRAWRRRVSSR